MRVAVILYLIAIKLNLEIAGLSECVPLLFCPYCYFGPTTIEGKD